MAIFSRRILQHLINENAEFLKRSDSRKIVGHLNRMHKELTLAPEWEVVIINAFSKLGTVEYERNFGGTRNPDISFTPFALPEQSVALDITTLSDKGSDANNPLDELHDQVMDRVQARGLKLGGFQFRVEGTEGHKYRRYRRLTKTGRLSKPFFEGGKKTRLKLPGVSRFREKILNAQFEHFLDEIQAHPRANRDHMIYDHDESIHLTISYRPGEMYTTMSFPSYKQIAHISENQVYQTLEDKANQLLDSGFEDRLGIILCDGDYSPFHEDAASVDDVIKVFLDERSEINFVLTLKIKRKRGEEAIESRLYRGQFFELLTTQSIDSLKRMVELLPQPADDTTNAFNHLKSRYPQEGRRCGMTTVYRNNFKFVELRLPTRMLMELLAGRLPHSTFSKLQGYEGFEGHPKRTDNPFALYLEKGWRISDMKFESRAPDEDNDFLLLTIDTCPDAAIHPAAIPPSPAETPRKPRRSKNDAGRNARTEHNE